MEVTQELLFKKIKTLNETIWERRAERLKVDRWLENFKGESCNIDNEKKYALYLLSKFMYFGDTQIKGLLKALFRDLYKYRIVKKIRETNANTKDIDFIEGEFKKVLKKTRFLGLGNPSESGTHLLYGLRQINGLPKELFLNTHEIFERFGSPRTIKIKDPNIETYIYIDDICGSGSQALDYSSIVEDLKACNKDAQVNYYCLFATLDGLDKIKRDGKFDGVDAVLKLDSSFKCFEDKSRYFPDGITGINKAEAMAMASHYGEKLFPNHSLGFKKTQLLIGFHHNVPDNTLPIIWSEGTDTFVWNSIFLRYEKKYTFNETR